MRAACRTPRSALGSRPCEKTTLANYRIETRNPGGHSAAPVRDNAIYQLSRALVKIDEHEFPLEMNDTTRKSFSDGGALRGDDSAKSAVVKRVLLWLSSEPKYTSCTSPRSQLLVAQPCRIPAGAADAAKLAVDRRALGRAKYFGLRKGLEPVRAQRSYDLGELLNSFLVHWSVLLLFFDLLYTDERASQFPSTVPAADGDRKEKGNRARRSRINLPVLAPATARWRASGRRCVEPRIEQLLVRCRPFAQHCSRRKWPGITASKYARLAAP